MKIRTTTTAVLLTIVPLLLLPVPAAAQAQTTGCEDPSGVTVVVDFTEVGGGIETGCAVSDFETGRTALEAAGFTLTDSQPGLICAINSLPDPCPETFEGSFWSYWYGEPGGEWASYMTGADTSSPAPDQVEGWRYNDGSAGPGIAPPAPGAGVPAEDGPVDDVVETEPQAAVAQDNTVALAVGGVLLVGVLGLVVWLVARKRLRSR